MIEQKVQAGSLAAAVSGAAIWALQYYVFKGSSVPAGLVSLIYVAIPGVLAFAAGYYAKHTHRPDLAPAPVPAPAVPVPPSP
jgi:hypothetical protein